MIGYSFGSLSKEPMVGNREVYTTRMCEIESSYKKFTRNYVLRNKILKKYESF